MQLDLLSNELLNFHRFTQQFVYHYGRFFIWKLFKSVSVLYGILFDFQSWFVVQQHWRQYYRSQWKKYFADWFSILFSNRLIRESSQVLNC